MLKNAKCDVKGLRGVDIFHMWSRTCFGPENAIYQTDLPARYMIQPQYQAQSTVLDSQSQVRCYNILNTACYYVFVFSRYYMFSKSSLDIFLVVRTWQCTTGIGGIRGNPGPGVEGVFRLTFEQCKARFSGSGHNFVYHQRSLHCQKMNHYIPGITDGNTDWRSCTQDQSQSTYASSNIVV